MITVLYLVPTLKRCGPTSQLYNVIKYMDRSVFRPVVITLTPEPADSRWQDFNKLAIELVSLGLSRIKTRLCMILPPAAGLGYVLAVSKLKNILHGLNVHIIHAMGIRADCMAAMYLKEYHTVATVRSRPQDDYSLSYGKFVGYASAYYHIRILAGIESLVTISSAIARRLSAGSNRPVTIIRNGVDTEIFHPAIPPETKESLRKKLGIPTAKKVFISVGHLTPLKDPFTIIRAFQSPRLSEDCAVFFLGNGPLMDQCKVYEKKASMVFLGSVPSVAEYLRAGDFYISSSQTEGMPNGVMEAMACGLPCVLSDIEAHREMTDADRKSAKLFEVKNVNAAISQIEDALKEDYPAMSHAAVGIIRDHFNAKKMSENYQALYSKIIGGN